ncbi:MAG: EAL domain-containing protein [Acidobacteriota bacterium]
MPKPPAILDAPLPRSALVCLALGTAWLSPPGLGPSAQPAGDDVAAEATLRVEGAERVRLRHYSRADGLAGPVRAVTQDRRGFLWLLAGEHPQRFDGFTFRDVGGPDLGAAKHLLPGENGELWIAGGSGLARLAADTLQPTPLDPPPWGDPAAVAADPTGTLWVGGDLGLWHLPPGGDAFEPFAGDDPAPVTALHVGPRGDLWIALGDGALRRRPPAAAKTEALGPPPDSADDEITALLEDDGGSLWIGHRSGRLVRLSARSGAWDIEAEIAAPGAVNALHEGPGRRLWIATDDGLAALAPGTTVPRPLSALADDGATAAAGVPGGVDHLFEDRGGLLWAAGPAGLTSIDLRTRFGRVRLASRGGVRALHEDSKGDLWVGTDNGLVRVQPEGDGLMLDAGSVPPPPAGTGTAVRALYEDRDRRLWIGADDALHSYLPPAETLTTYRHDPEDSGSLGPGAVRSLLQDDDGRLWIGLFGGGLDRLDRGGNRFEHYREVPDDPFSLPDDRVSTLFRDRRGQLWIGTAEGLARRTADGRFHAYRHDPEDRTSLRGRRVFAVHQDRVGNLWVGTDAGLERLPAEIVAAVPNPSPNNRGFSHLGEADGLPPGGVRGVLEDDLGRFWLATPQGLRRLDPATGEMAVFDLGDGLQALDFHPGTALGRGDGRFYFGGPGGYNVFLPEAVVVNTEPPQVVITALDAGGGDLADGRPPWTVPAIELDRRRATFTVEMAALDFADPAANTYAYRLDDGTGTRGWRSLGRERAVEIDGLAPGRHRLRIRAANDDGIWSQETTALDVRVRSAPWNTPWAYALYAAALLFAGVAWNRGRRRSEEPGADPEPEGNAGAGPTKAAAGGNGAAGHLRHTDPKPADAEPGPAGDGTPTDRGGAVEIDLLTGLPDRGRLMRHLETALARGQGRHASVALLLGDLDQLRRINDDFGRAQGDLFVQRAARRVLDCVRGSDLVARYGGDEIAVVLEDVMDPRRVMGIAERIVRAFAEPIVLDRGAQDPVEVQGSLSVGIAVAPQDGEDGPTLLRHAETALREAKAGGRDGYRFYERGMRDSALERLVLEHQLRRAHDTGELTLHFQPKLDLAGGRISGVETLLRWAQPDGEILTPGRFIRVAEETGLIRPIDEWVLTAACEQAAAWRRDGLPDLQVAVNLSADPLVRPGFLERLEAVLQATDTDPGSLVLEITASAIEAHREAASQVLADLAALGVRLSLDDFGHPASLASLGRLHLHEVKIDRTLMRGADAAAPGADGLGMVRAIRAMADALDLDVVAVGIETPEQLAALAEDGGCQVQGFAIGRPMPADELTRFLLDPEPAWRDILRSGRAASATPEPDP